MRQMKKKEKRKKSKNNRKKVAEKTRREKDLLKIRRIQRNARDLKQSTKSKEKTN